MSKMSDLDLQRQEAARIYPRFDNEHHVQAEHDIFTLANVIDDIKLDWQTPTGHRTILENAARIEAAADDLARIVERIRNASTSRVVDLRKFA